MQRITVAEIIEDEWFQRDYAPSAGIKFQEKNDTDEDVQAVFESERVIMNNH